jgi:type IV secretory pathway VirB10-like protein
MADAMDRLAGVGMIGPVGLVVLLVLGATGCTTPATPPKEPAPAVTQLERTTPAEPARDPAPVKAAPVEETPEQPAATPTEPEPGDPAADPDPEPQETEEALPTVPGWYALGPNVSGIRVSAGGDATDADLREARRMALAAARERLVSVVGEKVSQTAIPDRTAVREVEGGYRVFVTVFVDRPQEGPGDGGSDG